MFIYLQTTISFCHNSRIYQTDGQTDVDSKTVRMHSQSHGKKPAYIRRATLVNMISESYSVVPKTVARRNAVNV